MTAVEVLQNVCTIIKTYMGLAKDQVWIWDQKVNIPPDQRLYIAVGVLACKPFSNINTALSSGTVEDPTMDQDQFINMQATLSIDIFSRDMSALERKEEILLALNSQLSSQLQAQYGFMIARLPIGFVNLSQLEGAAIPYRFNISVNVQYAYTKNKSAEFYDDFTDSVTTEA